MEAGSEERMGWRQDSHSHAPSSWRSKWNEGESSSGRRWASWWAVEVHMYDWGRRVGWAAGTTRSECM